MERFPTHPRVSMSAFSLTNLDWRQCLSYCLYFCIIIQHNHTFDDSMKPTASGQRHEWHGYLLVMSAATLWAVAGVLAKYLMVQALSPIILAEMRVTIASGILLVILLLKDRQLLRIHPKNLLYMAILGVVGIAGVNYTYYYAISQINVAMALLVQYTAPAFVMLFAVLFQGETFSWKKGFALCVAFIGCFLTVGGYDLNFLAATRIGILSAFFSALLFAFYTLFAEFGLKRYSVWTILFYAFTMAAIFWWCLAPPWKILTAHYPLQTWLFFLSLAIVSTVLPFGLFFQGIRRIKATQASITGMIEPVVAGLLAYLLLDETLAPLQLVGAGLVLGGILLLQLERHPLS